jgi:hypothetical protein
MRVVALRTRSRESRNLASGNPKSRPKNTANNMRDLLQITSLALAGLLFVAACTSPWILAAILHTIN